jgi:uncharacterized membrane protein
MRTNVLISVALAIMIIGGAIAGYSVVVGHLTFNGVAVIPAIFITIFLSWSIISSRKDKQLQ